MSRVLLMTLGFVLVAIGALGVIVPVLPTTPFLLLAAACFARSSQRFYDWLLSSRLFGGLIRNWRDSRSIPRNAKRMAITMILLVGGSSVLLFITAWQLQLLVTTILLLNMLFVARLPCTEEVQIQDTGVQDYR